MTEKRKFRRLSIPPIACRLYQDCRLIDLSIGGAFLQSDHPLAPGTETSIELTLPSAPDRALRASVRVEWAGDYFAGKGAPCVGMGLSFLGIRPEDRVAIAEFLRKAWDSTRGALKVATRMPVRIRGGEGPPADGLLREIGERSLFVETGVVAGLGDEVELTLKLPNATYPVEMGGIVLRVEPTSGDPIVPPLAPHVAPPSDGPDDPAPASKAPSSNVRGLRIELRDLTIAARELIKAYLEDIRMP